MGITFLAAGTSVPEAVSSVIVAKQGELSGVTWPIDFKPSAVVFNFRSRFDGYQQFDWIKHIRHFTVSGSAMAHKSIIFAGQAWQSLRCNKLGWLRIFSHFVAIDIANVIRCIFTQQIQIGSKSWTRMSADVCGVLDTSQLN